MISCMLLSNLHYRKATFGNLHDRESFPLFCLDYTTSTPLSGQLFMNTSKIMRYSSNEILRMQNTWKSLFILESKFFGFQAKKRVSNGRCPQIFGPFSLTKNVITMWSVAISGLQDTMSKPSHAINPHMFTVWESHGIINRHEWLTGRALGVLRAARRMEENRHACETLDSFQRGGGGRTLWAEGRVTGIGVWCCIIILNSNLIYQMTLTLVTLFMLLPDRLSALLTKIN